MWMASIPSPSSNGVHLGPLDVHVYGLMYAVGVIAAVALTSRLWENRGGSRALVQDVALWAFPAGLIGGRLYFLATSWSEVPRHWWGPFAVWEGGLSIWGGIALGTVVGIWRLRRAGADVAAFMDVAAPGLLVAQAIGRIGNYFNQELFGRPTNLPWGLEISPAHRPAGYAQYATFHPTFLYELIFDLALAGVLLVLLRRGHVRPPGIFALYVTGYSGFRIFEETLRIDPSHHILGLRLNFFVAIALCLAGAVWFVRTQYGPRAVSRSALLIAIGVTAATLGACGTATSTASAKTTWLCKPGLSDNPCEPSLSTTVFDRYDGAGTVTHPQRLKRRKVDCFYVYPTVSDQQGPNATLAIDPELRSIALYQAARFSQVCRVFAPVYRQVTVPALSNGTLTAAVARRAYAGVLSAWKDYLARYNHGRGVVLIGHSQGAGHLQQLIRTRIDGRRIARRMVSAILLGGNVTVRKGRDTGGVFRHVRACRSKTQLGCVVAFSSFDATPPEDAIFGRTAGRFAGFFHAPSGPRYEVLCTNPGDLARNRRVAYSSFIPAQPFAPGTLIAAGISILGFTTPQASTTFVEGRGFFTGRCSSAADADVLRIESENGTPTLNPSPDATWGLHLLDANVAQGDLVQLVRAEAARYVRP